MSYLWSIHKGLRGSWIGHIEGPWSLSCLMTSFNKTVEQICLWKCLMEILDIKFFSRKAPKPPAQYAGKNSLPFGSTVTVMLRGNRSSPILHLPATTTIDFSRLAWIFLWLLIVATVCSTSCIFLCLPPSGPLSTGMQGQKSFFDTFWAFLYCLDSFWTIRTNYWLLREFEWEKLAKISCVAMLPRSYVCFWLHGRPIPDMTGK